MNYSQKRKQAFKLLGNKCVRCGFSDKRALQIDHVRGNGAEERRQYGAHALEVICEKIISGDSNDYQILCANCNWIKRAENHEARTSTSKYMKMKQASRKRFIASVNQRRVIRRRDGISYDLNGVPKT